MRIGVDATALYGRFGGVEYALWNLLLGLCECEQAGLIPRSRWRVWIPRDGPFQAARRFPDNWRFERLGFNGSQKARRIAWQQTILPQAARRLQLDVLHCATYVCPLRATVPIVLTIYDFIALSRPEFATRLNRAHYGLLLPRCAQAARRVLVPSQSALDDLSRFAPDARGVLVPLGVEDAFFEHHSDAQLEAARQKWDLPARFVLFVGNPEPKKNVRAIIHAMQMWTRQEQDDVPLLVTGGARAWKSFEPEALRQDSQDPLAEHRQDHAREVEVRSLGYVARRDLPLLFRLCSAFAFPSLAEGFGLPVLEALACGAPVVASSRVPIQGVERVARIVEPEDTAALSRELRELVFQERDEDLATRGREWARGFSWRRAALSTFEVYRDVAGASTWAAL